MTKLAITSYTDYEYRAQLVRHIKATRAGDRVLLMTMTFEPTEPEIAAIMREVELAVSRGVSVTLGVDAHSFLVSPSYLPGPLWNRRKMPKRISPYFKNKLDILDKIRSFPSGHAEIINQPGASFSLPVAGRSHIKAAIVNDQVFIGGCNLEHGNRVDLMLGWRDTTMSDSLYVLLNGIIQRKHAGQSLSWVDRGIDISDDATVFIDSGMRNQSVIFDEALRLIDSAEKWLVITCQYFPNSITARHLALAARRGVKLEVIYSHPKYQGIVGGVGQRLSILRERTRIPKALFKDALSRNDPMLHAKLIACDKGVMVGSHNYVKAGVMFGTAEIALLARDTKLAEESVRTLHRSLKHSAAASKSTI